MGIEVSRQETTSLFSEFDHDGGGTIEYRELNKLLRQRIKLDKRMRRVQSEPGIPIRVMPPGPARASLRPLVGSSSSLHFPPADGFANRSGLTLEHSQSASTLLPDPWKWPPQRTDLNTFAELWLMPRHGQDWRLKGQAMQMKKSKIKLAALV